MIGHHKGGRPLIHGTLKLKPPTNTKSSPLTRAAITLAQLVKEPRGELPTKESEVTLSERGTPFS